MVRKGWQTKGASFLPRIALLGSWGRFPSQVNHPKAPEFIPVGGRGFLAVFLQKPVSSEHLHCPETKLLSGALGPFSSLPFQSYHPLASPCTCSHHQEPLPRLHAGLWTFAASLTPFAPLTTSTHLSVQLPLCHQSSPFAQAHGVSWDSRFLVLKPGESQAKWDELVPRIIRKIKREFT